MPVFVETIVVGRWAVNCLIVHDGTRALIVDPGDDADQVAGRIAALGVIPVAILTTHAHFDHVGAVAPLKRRYGIPYHVHRADKRLLSHANLYRSLTGDRSLIETPVADQFLTGGPLVVGGLELEVIHTPGHTPGSVCFRIGDRLLSGDTLLADRAGRTDLPGGSAEELAASLDLLRAESPDLQMHPGHGPAASLGDALLGAVEATRAS